MTNENIHLFIRNGSWMARTSNPQIVNLFGTDTLPLPFTAEINSYEVLTHVHGKNPEATITIES